MSVISKFVAFLKLIPDVFVYAVVLVIAIVKASLSMTKLITAPEIDVEPRLVKFKAPLKTQTARCVLANSITLSPGAVTVSSDGDEFLVHALNRNIADGLQNSIFERLLAGMEKKINA